jgi:hypothetical protein
LCYVDLADSNSVAAVRSRDDPSFTYCRCTDDQAHWANSATIAACQDLIDQGGDGQMVSDSIGTITVSFLYFQLYIPRFLFFSLSFTCFFGIISVKVPIALGMALIFIHNVPILVRRGTCAGTKIWESMDRRWMLV